jgi:hypothetical protein
MSAHAVLAGFEDIRLQQGVVPYAGQMNAVIGQHMLVVLQVLADLGVRRRFQPRLQQRQHFVTRQLRRHARIFVGERQVGRLTRRDRQRHADDARGEGVKAGGLGIERGQRTAADLLQPAVERRSVNDRCVGRAVRVVGEQVGLIAGRLAGRRCGRRNAARVATLHFLEP